MILTKEDYDGLTQVLAILQRICKNAVMSEIEEKHERNFDRLNKPKNEQTFFSILSRRRKQMPFRYRDLFNEQWFMDHTRLKPNGTYEIRCSIEKTPISGAGKNLDTATENFIMKLVALEKGKRKPEPQPKEVKRVLFNTFAEQWLVLVKKPTLKPISYASTVTVYGAHIKPYFKRKFLDELTAMQIQPLFTKLTEQKKTKAAQDVKLILNQIFKAAIAERLIDFNPMDNVKVLKHHCKNGTALTYEEEREFLDALNGSKYRITFALMIFCGMRRAELCTARIEKGFVIVKNGKRRLSELETERKIPITPMLKPFIDRATAAELCEALSYSCDVLSRAFKQLCPAHHLHELRHTFVTRCQECGVAREVVSVWAGHSADNTMTSTVYTHFSEEFMLSEGKKVDYYNRLEV